MPLLPEELKRELDLPGNPGESHRNACARNAPECGRSQRGVRQIKLRGVEEVKEFCAKLHVALFVKTDVLEHGSVELLGARSFQNTDTRIAVGEGRRSREARGVEPAFGSRLFNLEVTGKDSIGPAAEAGVRHRCRQPNCVRFSALKIQ